MKHKQSSPQQGKQNTKDPIRIQQQRQIQRINRERFDRDWKITQRGPSLANYEYTVMSEALSKIMNKAKDLVHASKELAEMLAMELGYQHWNVIIVNGPFSRKTYASGGYFCIFQRFDGTQAIIWLNKLTYENTMAKSTLQQSEYF